MKKKTLAFLVAIFLAFFTSGIVLATPGNKHGRAKTPPFPQPAEENLQKVVFIRYAPGKEPACNNNNVCEKKENHKNCPNDCQKKNGGEEPVDSACYGFLSGAKPKWASPEPYAYASGLGSVSNQATSTWNTAVSATIFGSGEPGSYDWGVYDYENSISYGDYEDPNVIAVTAIWFRGKNIYEYDIMFDNDYFSGGGYDLETVALHEFGHGAGLDDLYTSECRDEVMYGYYENPKTTLGEGDLAGIRELYGE